MKIVRPHAITPGALVHSSIAEDDHPVYSAGATYAQGDLVIVDHQRFESLQSGNVGHPPASSPAWWLPLGATNRWAMFDDRIGSQSMAAGEITVKIAVTGRADVVALLNISGLMVRVVAEDAIDGVIYDRTMSLASDSGIADWYSYFFEPIERATSLVLSDLPLYSGVTLTVTLSAPSGNVALGVLLVGQSKDIGETQYGVKLGIHDYSLKSRDEWGSATIVPRDYSSTGSFTVEVENHLVDRLHSLLAGYRATPILWIGSDRFSSTYLYGFFTNFSILISYFSLSVCTIEIESLT